MPERDELRVEKLKSYLILDTEAESQFDRLTGLAAAICKTPIALVSLLDDSRQWFKSRIGLDTCETPRDISFCQFAIHQDAFFEIEDAHQDERFSENPLVTGPPYVRYYGGQPLITPDNFRIGTICVIDTKPRKLDAGQKESMGVLAHEIVMHLELRIKTIQLKKANELENRRAQDLLIQSGKLASLGQLIASVTHEIQNPLWIVEMSSQNQDRALEKLKDEFFELRKTADLSEAQTKSIESIFSNSDKSADLTRQSLSRLNDLFHALKKQSHPDPRPSYDVQVEDIIHDAIIITQGKLIEHEVKTRISELPPCCCYRSRLGQVFINILSNAADALVEQADREELHQRSFQGRITVEAAPLTRDDVPGINVSFSDNGPGVPSSIKRHLFTEFFTTKAPGKGTGLGLSLSKSIIEQHEGEILVEDSDLGGAKFTVWIPLDIPEEKQNHDL